MSKFTLQVEFGTLHELQEFLAAGTNALSPHHVGVAGINLTPTAAHVNGAANPTPPQGIMPLSTAAAAQAAAEVLPTQDAVRKAMMDYVARANGRSAATAKAILTKHGVESVKAAPADKWAGLIAEFDQS